MNWTDELHEHYENIADDIREYLRRMLQRFTEEEQQLICEKLQEVFRFWL